MRSSVSAPRRKPVTHGKAPSCRALISAAGARDIGLQTRTAQAMRRCGRAAHAVDNQGQVKSAHRAVRFDATNKITWCRRPADQVGKGKAAELVGTWAPVVARRGRPDFAQSAATTPAHWVPALASVEVRTHQAGA